MVFFELFMPTVGVLLFSLFILVIINLFYRVLINQDNAARAKDRVKEIGEEMKKYKEDKEKTSQLLKEMMTENSKVMKMSFKPMIISFLIVILLLPFLATVYGDRYTSVNNSTYTGNVTIDDTYFEIQKADSKLTIRDSATSTAYECEMPCREQINTTIPSKWNILQEGDRIKFERIVALFPFTLPFFGDDAGWILWYLLCSIPLMIIIRKMMGIKV